MSRAQQSAQEAGRILLDFVDRYGPAAGEEGPVLFAQEVFGVDLDPWQIDTLRAYGRGEPRIAIKACHGPGKTFLASVMVWHMMLCRFPQHTVATAPSSSQLEDALVKEIQVLHTKLPPILADLFEVKKNRIELLAAPDESFFSARTARAEKPEALQGIHCDGGYVLLIGDEASGIDNAIFESAAGSMSGANTTTLLLSNPTKGSGFFFDCFNRNREMWHTVTVSAWDSTRVTDDFVKYIAQQFGEDSSAYRVRVMGEFPLADDDTVIPLEFVESARNRDIVLPKLMNRFWGVDVARGGGDSNALVVRSNLSVEGVEEWPGQDLMATVGRIKAKWDETPDHERPEWILVDVIGLGAGVVDRLRELRLPVRGVNVSESASSREKYLRLRDELWFAARDWLGRKDVKLPRCEGGCGRDCVHERLAGELTVPKFQITSSGKYQVEAKDAMKKRGFKSPNVADAFVHTFAATQAGIIHGSRGSAGGWGSVGWNEPFNRGLTVV